MLIVGLVSGALIIGCKIGRHSMIDAQPFDCDITQSCGNGHGPCVKRLLHCFKERECKGLEDREHAGDQLGHSEHSFRCLEADGGLMNDLLEHAPVAVGFTWRETPRAYTGIEIYAQHYVLILVAAT